MQGLIQTAERVSNTVNINNYVFQRHFVAYKSIPFDALWNKDVLELGCGNGYGMAILAPDTNSYVGIDKNKPAKRNYSDNATFMQMNLSNLQQLPGSSFDTIICFQVIEHIVHDIQLLEQIERMLKPGGRLFLTTPNQLMSLTRNPFHIREYTPQTMQELFSQVFNNYHIQGVYGNNKIKQYYKANKTQVEKITRFDIFNLQEKAPRWLLQIPYSFMNNISRLLIFKKENDLTANIQYSDFYIDEVGRYTLDFFITATK